ncbi:arylamine N-acetyltransferase family protein [Nitrospira defluvii]|uniref:Arylamine N-acetyltransferase n=1 Tax=Nitrospira defluvii TaxID=330214 RepID=A0ABM8RES9_9BACT|nr:arylamine N-acetyltransferase [Nitrospira defluvii]CAE6749087.1 Arylamine N-acetyltransferase [Nitrospira defluvii]
MVDRDAYLARIGYEGALTPSIETLRGLHRAHVMTVPFENLDIHLGRAISLDPADLFRKIVLDRRGGYCFELNGLFALLLEDVGFAVTRLAARVSSGAEGVRPRSHQLLMVTVGKAAWIVDVGFGGHGLLEPLKMVLGEEGRQGHECFRLVAGERDEYLLQGEREGAWVDLYSFGLDACLPVDYTFASYYHSHSPDSLFMQKRICTMPTPEGRKTLTDMVLKVRGGGDTQERQISDEEYKQLLQQHFGLIINDRLKF